MKSTTCKGPNGQFLEEYHSRSAAELAGEYLSRDTVKYFPIQCRSCSYWHLAPENTKRQCYFCTDTGLFLKDIYTSKDEALRTAEWMRREKKIVLYPYKCPHGSGWHLTKRER